MSQSDHFDLCVLGGGAGGLATAIGAALLGVRVALVEAGPPGADGTAALARAAFLAAPVPGDLEAVRGHVASVLAAAAPASAPERLAALGIALLPAAGRFTGPDRIQAAGRSVTARRFVLAPQAAPALPSIPGIENAPLMDPNGLPDAVPARLAILGDGAEALELAQAYRRLGSAVTLVSPAGPLADEDPELVEPLLLQLRTEGIRFVTGRPVERIEAVAGGVRLVLAVAMVEADRLLVADGRRPDLSALGLDAAGITHGAESIETDAGLRTGNRRVYAVIPGRRPSDATAAAGVVLRNILFRQRRRFDPAALPRMVGTRPALAQVGPTERQCRAMGLAPTILRCPLHEIDRARAAGTPHGLVKVVTDKSGEILGAGLVGTQADELIQTWQLAISERLNISSVANLCPPYPTLGEASKRAAGSFFAPRLLSARTRRFVRLLAMLG